jgi:hypothetical protein
MNTSLAYVLLDLYIPPWLGVLIWAFTIGFLGGALYFLYLYVTIAEGQYKILLRTRNKYGGISPYWAFTLLIPPLNFVAVFILSNKIAEALKKNNLVDLGLQSRFVGLVHGTAGILFVMSLLLKPRFVWQ